MRTKILECVAVRWSSTEVAALHLCLGGHGGTYPLTEATDLGQTLVSHHLTALGEQDLVTATPRGRSNVNSLCCDALAAPVQLLASLAALTPEGARACSAASIGLTRPAADQD